eukprot:4728082-Pleurochrysis_carterae.AAC.1
MSRMSAAVSNRESSIASAFERLVHCPSLLPLALQAHQWPPASSGASAPLPICLRPCQESERLREVLPMRPRRAGVGTSVASAGEAHFNLTGARASDLDLLRLLLRAVPALRAPPESSSLARARARSTRGCRSARRERSAPPSQALGPCVCLLSRSPHLFGPSTPPPWTRASERRGEADCTHRRASCRHAHHVRGGDGGGDAPRADAK